MTRRLFLACGWAACCFSGVALADGFSDSVVSQLRQQGYDRISVERTLLGRTQIVGSGNGGRREIILNPRTGEILRDLWLDGGSGSGSGSGSGARGDLISDDDSGKGRGRGGRDDDTADDRYDNEADDDDDDDDGDDGDDSKGSDDGKDGGDDD